MNKIVLNIVLVSLFLCLNNLNAQQVPFYNHYKANPVVYNPAYAGLDGNFNAFITRGQRYTGIGTGAVDNTFSIEGKFFIPNSGFGLFVGHQSAGALSQLGAKMTYSYRVQFGEDHNLGLGISAGYLENRIRTDQFNVMHEHDPFLEGIRDYRPSFDMNAGLVYKNKDLQIGFSIPQVLGNKVKFAKNKSRGFYTLARHMLLTSSYDFRFNAIDKLILTPYALLRFVPGAPIQYDIAAQLKYENIGWFSTTYKSDYAVQFNLGFHIFKHLHIGYSYEWVVGSSKNYYSGVNHEFLLGYTFKTGKSETKRVEIEIEVPDPNTVKENEELKRQLKEKEEQLQAKEELERKLREQLEEEQKKAINAVKKEVEDRGDFIQTGGDYKFIEVNGSDAPNGYYVVIGVYSEKNNLNKNLEEVRQSYSNSYYIINTKKNNYNYIVIQYTLDREEALKIYQDYSNSTGKKVWILEYKQ